MILHPSGTVAVIFCAQRTAEGEAEYQAAATEMSQLAAKQHGFLGEDHARSADGVGITVSYWCDDDSAKAWRDDPQHAAIREKGRDLWYEEYSLHVTRIERSYAWQK